MRGICRARHSALRSRRARRRRWPARARRSAGGQSLAGIRPDSSWSHGEAACLPGPRKQLPRGPTPPRLRAWPINGHTLKVWPEFTSPGVRVIHRAGEITARASPPGRSAGGFGTTSVVYRPRLPSPVFRAPLSCACACAISRSSFIISLLTGRRSEAERARAGARRRRTRTADERRSKTLPTRRYVPSRLEAWPSKLNASPVRSATLVTFSRPRTRN